MSMQKLRGIRNMGAYTAQRSMLEHLLRLEEIILREIPKIKDIPTTRKRIAQHIQKYKTPYHISNSFSIEDIQHYLLATTEQHFSWEKSQVRGLYTSALIEQTEGDEPITIDMLGNKIEYLLYAINTPRHITISNTNGNYTGSHAGSDRGQANLAINNTKGDWTGSFAGYDHGKAQITINNTEGNQTGAPVGNINGKAIIVAYNNKGANQFFKHQGTIVSYNQNETPIIEGITREQRTHIRALIAQNTSPEDIMAYLVKHT